MNRRDASNMTPRHLKIRQFKLTDLAATYAVFFTAVRQGAAEFYSLHDREAWAGSPKPPDNWVARLSDQDTRVAELEGRVVGFMSLMRSGHIDMAFVLPEMMGTGVSARLYKTLEDAAYTAGLDRLTTDASFLAKSFFTKQGWEVLAPQTVLCNGRKIKNFQMEKQLS